MPLSDISNSRIFSSLEYTTYLAPWSWGALSSWDREIFPTVLRKNRGAQGVLYSVRARSNACSAATAPGWVGSLICCGRRPLLNSLDQLIESNPSRKQQAVQRVIAFYEAIGWEVEQAMELTSAYRLGNFHNQARILKTILDYRLLGDAALIAEMDAAGQQEQLNQGLRSREPWLNLKCMSQANGLG